MLSTMNKGIGAKLLFLKMHSSRRIRSGSEITFVRRNHPFEVLPSVPWEVIMDSLKEPQDKLNVMRTNSVLAALFERRSQNWMLPAVLPLVLKHGMSRDDEDFDPSLLNIRTLSTKCIKIVDVYIDQEIATLTTYHQYQGAHFLSKDELQRFNEANPLGTSARTPSLLRNVFLTFQDEGENPSKDDILHLFEKVGPKLKYICIQLEVTTTYRETAGLMQKMFQLAPNLEMISLSSYKKKDVHIPVVAEYEEMIGNFNLPLPDMKRLTNLTIRDNISRGPASPLSRYLRFDKYLPQLESIQIDFLLFRNYEGNDFPVLECLWLNKMPPFDSREALHGWLSSWTAPKLRKLSFDVLTPSDNWEEEEEEEMIEVGNFMVDTISEFLGNRYPDKAFRNYALYIAGVNIGFYSPPE